ncbi:fimbrial protein [Citrobacter portucalensis]|uniref:Fimbrial protein n=1 Tax=Citrobacter portucalensis TaxID=1639133 RepID=A0A5B0T4K0_9ENTR|nr:MULTISPECIES: fimbrial protein [Citrobacter]KAA1144493.1 fimbrial protein [Citrobacter portucalensis]QRQ73506.1 fimbrial protein [Citrobacter sp. B72]
MKRIDRISVLAWVLLALPAVAQASCYLGDGVSGEVPGYVSFGTVMVQRDTPVGAVLATSTTGAYNGGNRLAGCSEPWTYRWEITQWGTLSALGNSIYNTNLPGVGIRLTNTGSGKVIPYDESRGVVDVVITGDGIKAELIKTGDITGGTLTPGVLARASVVNQFYFANVTLNGTSTVTSTACTVTTPDVNVPLGDHDKSGFSGVGSGTGWQTFSIGLECDPGARINVRIDATADPSEAPGVMALDGGSGEMAATGVGVQLWSVPDDSAVQFGQVKYYGTSSAGGLEAIQYRARYYQTASAVTAGPASATATFTLTYK